MNNYNDIQIQRTTDEWLRSAGIDSSRLTADAIELQHAQRLATQMLRENSSALAQNQAHTLQNFLLATMKASTRNKITRAQCYKILNIAKQAQRALSKQRKKIRRLRKGH